MRKIIVPNIMFNFDRIEKCCKVVSITIRKAGIKIKEIQKVDTFRVYDL